MLKALVLNQVIALPIVRAGGEFVFIAATEVGNPPNTAKMTAHSFPRCRSCRRMSQYGTTATAEAK
jgi:hypothetical protein